MNTESLDISESIETLNVNLRQVAQVGEWANLMGYQNAKKFSRRFLRHYAVRPCRMLVAIRLKSIFKDLQTGNYSNFEIARRHSLPDEKALNKFVNYHLGCCPSELESMTEPLFKEKMEKFGSKIW
jgi:methylphosphotriester-DNA--protein-cysteine methyltransferase